MKDIGERLADLLIAGAERARALHVEIEQHVDAGLEILQHEIAPRAVVIAVHLGVLEELAGLEPRQKFLVRK